MDGAKTYNRPGVHGGPSDLDSPNAMPCMHQAGESTLTLAVHSYQHAPRPTPRAKCNYCRAKRTGCGNLDAAEMTLVRLEAGRVGVLGKKACSLACSTILLHASSPHASNFRKMVHPNHFKD